MQNIIKPRLKDSYDDDTVKASYLIAINSKNLTYYGSNALKSQFMSSSDVDLIERLPKSYTAKYISDRIRNIVINLNKEPDAFLGDFKAGLHHKYYINLGTIENGKVVGLDKAKVSTHIRNTPIKDDELSVLTRILKKKTVSMCDYFIMEDILREYYLLRWDEEELLQGYKMVDGHKILLEEAIQDDTLVKIDSIQLIDGNFVEVTNVFDTLGDTDHLDDIKFSKSLRMNLIKYYCKKNYFKLIKRIFSYAKIVRNKPVLEKCYSILSTSLGLLYKGLANFKAIQYVLETYDKITKEEFEKMLDNIGRLKNNISAVYNHRLPEKKLYNLIDSITRINEYSSTQHEFVLERLNHIIEIISENLNKFAYAEMSHKGLLHDVHKIMHE